MKYVRMPIEIESPEQMGYGNLKCNLTESSMRDARLGELDLDLRDLVICYGDHLGHPGLRRIIAQDGQAATAQQTSLGPDDVLLTAGAATALFIIATSLLEKGDRLVVMRPNYATNIETPRAIGADIAFLELEFERGWRVDLSRLEKLITPQTRLVSLTTPHNPTGSMMDPEDLRAIIRMVEAAGCYLLCDETYREMSFGPPLPVAATLSERAISVSSLSKTWGLPGIRLGWLSTRDRRLQELFLAAKEQIMVTGSVVDEEIGFRFLSRKAEYLSRAKVNIDAHFAIVKQWIADETSLEWVEPVGGALCFPRIREDSGLDVEAFYRILNQELGTFVGPGHWFEMPRRYMRIGYGWPTMAELKEGLANISAALRKAQSR
jgi:aspartate/methionine/tyrosine aminotransferase